jgi:hypothetical protein
MALVPNAVNQGHHDGVGDQWRAQRRHGKRRNLDAMCRNIRPLNNFAPPASDVEVHEAALQYVRKLSGSARPSQANADAFDRAVGEVAAATRRLLDELVSTAPPKNREVEAAKARARAEVRYAR